MLWPPAQGGGGVSGGVAVEGHRATHVAAVDLELHRSGFAAAAAGGGYRGGESHRQAIAHRGIAGSDGDGGGHGVDGQRGRGTVGRAVERGVAGIDIGDLIGCGRGRQGVGGEGGRKVALGIDGGVLGDAVEGDGHGLVAGGNRSAGGDAAGKCCRTGAVGDRCGSRQVAEDRPQRWGKQAHLVENRRGGSAGVAGTDRQAGGGISADVAKGLC